MLKDEIVGILSGSFILCAILFIIMGAFRRAEYTKFLILAIIFVTMADMLFCYYLGYCLGYNRGKTY